MKFVLKCDTDYCGTDETALLEAGSEAEAEEMAHTIAYDHACGFFNVISCEQMEEYENDPDIDEEDFITEDQISFSIEEYNDKEHNYITERW